MKVDVLGPVPTSPHGICKALTSLYVSKNKDTTSEVRSGVKVKVDVLGPVPTSPHGPCGRKATVNE